MIKTVKIIYLLTNTSINKNLLFLSSLIVSCAVILCCTVLITPARAADTNSTSPYIAELTVSNSNSQLLAYFNLEDPDSNQIKNILASGVPVKYIYDIRLFVPGKGLFGLFPKEIASFSISRTITYDNIKGCYQIHIVDGKSDRDICVTGFKAAQIIACQINDLPVAPLDNLIHGAVHVLKVRARVERVLSSVPFKDILNLFSSEIFETDWYEVRFNY